MEYSFLINQYHARQVALKFLAEDSRAARLSGKFQAYYILRPLIPLAVRQWLQRNRKVEVREKWYLPEDFIESLASSLLHDGDPLKILHPWPDGNRFGFVLTHDVETSDGMKSIQKLSEIEEEMGFRSSWNIVPYKYKIDRGLLDDLKKRGFEIGIHGYNHDGRLYTSKLMFERRARFINAALKEYCAVGFRSPMVHRNLEWLQLLDIEYDSSCFDIDPYQAMPGGVGGLWPFVAGRFVELPYTLPQDHTLFVAQGQADGRIWKDKLDYIRRHQGMALFLTHPDYMRTQRHLDLYRQLLMSVHEEGGYWHALPREVAQWWREREMAAHSADDPSQSEVAGRAAFVPAIVEVSNGDFSIRAA